MKSDVQNLTQGIPMRNYIIASFPDHRPTIHHFQIHIGKSLGMKLITLRVDEFRKEEKDLKKLLFRYASDPYAL